MSSEELEKLKEAATNGDVEFLRNCVASKKPNQYYMTFFPRDNPDVLNHYGNIFHLAVEENKQEFIREAIGILPPEDTQQLLLQPSDDENLWNPLHEAAKVGNLDIVKMLLDVYKPLPLPSDHSKRPWLQKDSDGQTPCVVALDFTHEECALEMLRMDMELSTMTDDDGDGGVLYNAVSNGFSKVALEILNSSHPFTCAGYKGTTPLHYVAKCTERAEDICKLLLQREPKLIKQRNKYGESVFHYWANDCKVWPFKCILDCENTIPDVRKDFVDLVAATTRKSGDNPLHNLVSYHQRSEERSLKVAQYLIETYKQETASLSDITLPWLVQNSDGKTPFSLALERKYEKFAMYILSLDDDVVINCQQNALFLAIEKGCHAVVEKILEIVDNKKWTKLLTNDQQENVLHLAPLCKNENIFKRLLEEHSYLLERVDKEGNSVLHHWLRNGSVWQLEGLLKSKWRNHIIKLIAATNYNEQDNPFHVAATSTHEATHQVLSLLAEAYKEDNPDWLFLDMGWLPWFFTNKANEGPLHLAIRNQNEKLASYLLSLHDGRDEPISELLNYYTPKHKTLFLAIEHNCPQVAKEILERLDGIPQTKYLRDRSTGRSVLHLASKCTDEDLGKWLLEKAADFISKPDKSRKTPLDEACDNGAAWFIQAIREMHPSAFNNAPLAWVKSCEKGHISAIRVFIDYNPGKFRDLCIKHKDSPLHHIKLRSLTEYEEFLEIPRMNKDLINLQNSKGATPLHVAIQSRNILLTETLLSMDNIRYNIRDENKKTATDLLAQVCKDDAEWDIMCQRIGFDPYITTSYFQRKTNLLDVRNSLFVVAALLATITFTAGFTLPGGLNDTGEAILAKEAAFLVFMISNTIAMCASMLVLICLVWSMVHSSNKSLELIDRSMQILMVAFYATLLAFMTGVYLVIASKVFWLAIFVIVMCCLIGISAYRTLLYKILVISSRKKNSQRDPIQQLELGISSEEQNPLLSHSEESSSESSDSSSETSKDSDEEDLGEKVAVHEEGSDAEGLEEEK